MSPRITRIGIGLIFSLIIAGFILPAVMDVFIRQTAAKNIAKIDGEPINEPHFFRLLGLSVQRLQTFYPKLTFQNLIQMNYPTDMLRDFVRRQIMRKHMLQEGFLVNEKTAIDLMKKQMSGPLPESKSERRMLVEDVKTAALLDQLVLPYGFSADYTKLLIQALSIQRQFSVTEIPYDKMVVPQAFTPDIEKAFLVQAEKKYKNQLMEPIRKDFTVIHIDPSKLTVTMEDAGQYFEDNKAKYKANAKFDDVAKEAETHVRLEKVRVAVGDVKAQLEAEKSMEDIAKGYGFDVVQKCHPRESDTLGVIPSKEGTQKNPAATLDPRLREDDKIQETLTRLEEEDHTVIADDQKEGHFYAIKVTKVVPAHMKTGADLTAALKDLWTHEQQREIAGKTALMLLDAQKIDAKFPTQKGLLVSMTTDPAQYPHKDLTPEMVERLMSARKGELHREYGREGILLFDIEKDVDGKPEGGENQRKAFTQMALDTAQQGWFTTALAQHKVDINISALHQRLG